MLRKKIMVLILSAAIIATSSVFNKPNFVQAVTVKKEYINNNRPGISLNPIGIVIHATDEPGGTAQNNRDYINTDASAKSSAHYYVDWNGTVQAIPESEEAWHAGPTANRQFLSVEMCEPYGNNQAKFNQVYENTIELVASICKRYGWNSNNIHSHKWVSDTYGETDHTDPIGYLSEYGKTWDQLVNDIQAAISGTGYNGGQTTPTTNVSGDIADLQEILNKSGYGRLTVDNQAGPATLAACPLLKNGSNGDLVKWVQSRLGVGADGIFGNGTKQAIISFQQTNGLDADGVIGKMTWARLLSLSGQSNDHTGSGSTGGQTTPTTNVSGDIAELQTILKNGGNGSLIIDNQAGPATLAACPLLECGSNRVDLVKWVQKKLNIGADGIFENGTKQAVENFQRANGLEADGEIGKMTWAKLLNSSSQGGSQNTSGGNTPSQDVSKDVAARPLTKIGDRGDVVKWIQNKLGVSADGIFGDATKQAVEKFQRENGLGADGIVGKATWDKLLNSSSQSDNQNTSGDNTPSHNSSGDIAELQTILKNNGNGNLIVDNQAGPATLAACPTLECGSNSDVVKWVQKRLGVGADGIFGSGTKQAVEKFQQANGLGADGVIGNMTWRKLLGM